MALEYEKEKYSNKDTCIINFRGGPEYILQPDLFLKKEYWYTDFNFSRLFNWYKNKRLFSRKIIQTI